MADNGIAELKEEVGKALTAFEEFKKTNDERLAQIAAKGSADPLTTEKLAKMEKSLATYDDLNQRVTAAALQAKKDKEDLEKRLNDEIARADRLEVALNRPGSQAATEEAAEKAAKHTERKVYAKYLRYGPANFTPDEAKALTVGDNTQAGYLAPVEYVQEIIKAEIEFSPIRSVARVRTTTRQSIQIPRRTGVFAAQWVAEVGTKTETTGLTYGLEDIPTHEFYALVDVSNQMLEDSAFNLEAEVASEFSEQFGVAEGAAFVTGTAVGKPEGFTVNASVGSTNSGTAATIADSDGQANGIIDLYHDLKTPYARNGVWLLNRNTLGSVRKLKDSQKNYIWMMGLGDLRPNTILGQPYVEVPDMADEGAGTYPMAFGDFRRAYTIVDRVQMSILRDPYTQAATGKVRYIARRRVGGQVVLPEAIRLLKCST